jgi:hypothetical protein
MVEGDNAITQKWKKIGDLDSEYVRKFSRLLFRVIHIFKSLNKIQKKVSFLFLASFQLLLK